SRGLRGVHHRGVRAGGNRAGFVVPKCSIAEFQFSARWRNHCGRQANIRRSQNASRCHRHASSRWALVWIALFPGEDCIAWFCCAPMAARPIAIPHRRLVGRAGLCRRRVAKLVYQAAPRCRAGWDSTTPCSPRVVLPDRPPGLHRRNASGARHCRGCSRLDMGLCGQSRNGNPLGIQRAFICLPRQGANGMSARLAPLTENAFVRALDAAEDPAEAGGKACNLNRMIGLGMNVPPGIVVTASAFRQFLNTAGLNAAISSIRRDSLNDLQDVAIAIQERIRASKVPAEILDPLLELRHSLLPHGRLIVRSSAVGEDSATASFAGQLDSFAGAATSEEIERALFSCWSSYWNERVLFYQQAKRVQLRGMGVIVQLLVESRISGVLFTQAPGDSARGGDLYAEFCAGPGEALVAGRVTPSRLRISRTDWQWTVEPGEENVSLDARHIESLARASVVLEMEFNAPQDIEWTVDGCDRIFLLQARPITAVAAAPRRVLWSNANVNENFPDVITPFLYSIAREGYYHYFRNLAIAFGLSSKRIQSMEYSFRHIIGVHHSRMYYNLTSIHSVLSQAPFGDSLSRFFNQFVGESQPETESRTAIESRWRSSIEVTKIAVHTTWQYMFI